MNDTTIQMIAQAVIANTKVIQSLIDALPHETKQAVAEVVNVTPAPAPVATPVAQPAPQPVIAPLEPVVPVSVTPTNPVASQPTAPVMPPPPSFTAPAAPAPASAVPFKDSRGLVEYVMGVYRELGPQKGQGIQDVLTKLGYANINEIRPDEYAALYAGVEQLKG